MPKQTVDLKKPLSATQQKVLDENPLRTYCLLVKDAGTDVIRLGLGIEAVSGRGPRLNSAGANYEINLTNPFHGAIYAVAESGTPDLCITEW